MTIVCATNDGLPGIRPCTELGEHRITCLDHPGWDEKTRPGTCRGCLPLAAEVGFLCRHCYEIVESAYPKWARFRQLLDAADGRPVSPTGGGGSAAVGYSNLPLTFLAVDECERHLATRGDLTLLMWVNTQDGAAHAIQFAYAALNAYESFEVEEREKVIPPPARCPHCNELTVTQNRARERGVLTIIECQSCGGVIDKVRTGADAWTGSDICEHGDPLDHLDCADVDCGCWCHDYGRKSHPALSTAALWDADTALATSGTGAPRGDWKIDGPHTIRHAPTDPARIRRLPADTERKIA